jgi:16S rRNA (cytidine1402-2'-O)-methyltransferase
VATPIGNLRDITFRALDALATADLVLAEDTRVTRRLFDAYGVKTRLSPYHEHNAEAVRPGILARLAEGARIALVSDAGTPLVSDPGYRLVKEAAEAGIAVYPIPGASAPLAGLAVSGLPTDRFLFAGFLPPRTAARARALAELAAIPATLIFFESPSRLAASLADMAAAFGARDAVVARELTKAFEETRRAPLPDLARHYADAGPPRGEIVVLVGPPGETPQWDDAALDRALRAALAQGSVKDAAASVATASGLPKRVVYARALALAGGAPQE